MKFINLIGKRFYSGISAKDYTNWAEGLLLDGTDLDSENVAILAGLGLEKEPDFQDVELYFQKSLKDLALTIPDKQEALDNYSSYLCEQLIKNKIAPKTAIGLLDALFYQSDYQPIYSIWSEIGDDIWSIENNEQPYINSTMTKNNMNEFIADVAKQFIVLLKMKLPDNFFKLCACSQCGYIGESEINEKNSKIFSKIPEIILRFFFIKPFVREAVCANCLTPFPATMGDFVAREHYIKRSLKDS